MVSTLRGQQPGQCRGDGSVRPRRAWSGDLSAQHRDFMAEHEDLGVLGCLPAGQEREPPRELTEDEVEQL